MQLSISIMTSEHIQLAFPPSQPSPTRRERASFIRLFYEKSICQTCMVLLLLAGCATPIKPIPVPASESQWNMDDFDIDIDPKQLKGGISAQLLKEIEAHAEPANAKVLKQGRIMLAKRVILRGGCWDYINAIWNKAGFPIKKRRTVFKSSIKGPYASANKIRSGDWLYFINHSYKNIQHSSMFVAWANKNAMRGYVLSYAGQRRKEPARYKIYDLNSVYQIIRPR